MNQANCGTVGCWPAARQRDLMVWYIWWLFFPSLHLNSQCVWGGGGDGRTGSGLWKLNIVESLFVIYLGFCSFICIISGTHLCDLGCKFYFGSRSGKNESSVNTFYTYKALERPEVSIYKRTCVGKTVLQLLSGPQRPSAFPCTAPIDSAGFPNAPPPLFFSPSASFPLSSTFLVFLCFTLCLHTTPWVVPSNNIWSFTGPPCQEFLPFKGVGKCPEPRDGSVLLCRVQKKKNANDVFAFSALVFGFLMFVEGLFPFTLMMWSRRLQGWESDRQNARQSNLNTTRRPDFRPTQMIPCQTVTVTGRLSSIRLQRAVAGWASHSSSVDHHCPRPQGTGSPEDSECRGNPSPSSLYEQSWYQMFWFQERARTLLHDHR